MRQAKGRKETINEIEYYNIGIRAITASL